eukprot:Selendium_serpulae@DN4348_c0_g1_i1.p1
MSRAGVCKSAQFGLMTPEQLYASIRALDQFAITVLPVLSDHDAQIVLTFAATCGASNTLVPTALPSSVDGQRPTMPSILLMASPVTPIRQPPPHLISLTSSVECNSSSLYV